MSIASQCHSLSSKSPMPCADGKTVYNLTASKAVGSMPSRISLRVGSQSPSALTGYPDLSSHWLRGTVHRDCSSHTGLKHTIAWEQAAIKKAWSAGTPPLFQVHASGSCPPPPPPSSSSCMFLMADSGFAQVCHEHDLKGRLLPPPPLPSFFVGPTVQTGVKLVQGLSINNNSSHKGPKCHRLAAGADEKGPVCGYLLFSRKDKKPHRRRWRSIRSPMGTTTAAGTLA